MDFATGELLSTMETVAGERSRYSARILSVTGLPASGRFFFFPVIVLRGSVGECIATVVQDTGKRARLAMGAETISLRDYRDDDLEEMTRVDDICFAADFRFDQASMGAFAEARNAVAVV